MLFFSRLLIFFLFTRCTGQNSYGIVELGKLIKRDEFPSRVYIDENAGMRMIVLTAIIANGIAPAVYASATFYWTGRPPRQRHIRFQSAPQACIPNPPSNTRQSEGEILRLVVKTVPAALWTGGSEVRIPKPQESRSPKYAGNLSGKHAIS